MAETLNILEVSRKVTAPASQDVLCPCFFCPQHKKLGRKLLTLSGLLTARNVTYDSCQDSSRFSSSIPLGGDFLSFLRKRKDELKLKQLVRFSLDVAAGMLYLESKNCIHR